jgi:hypothetical protein
MNELSAILAIETPHTHFEDNIVNTKAALKHKIRELKSERNKFVAIHDHRKLHDVRRQMHELKHTIRRMEASAVHR